MQHVRGKLKQSGPNCCLRLDLEYDGSKYSGWAEQRNARTVMGELRLATEAVLGVPVEMAGAGRTDAGVHARGQVAHLKFFSPRPPRPEQLLQSINQRLPAEIALRRIPQAPLAFHARHDAIEREYVYQIATRKLAFEKKYVWWVKEPLDIDLMQSAALTFVGRHDFRCFQAPDPARPRESSIVVVHRSELSVIEDHVLFRIAASHFLWRMVRRLMGVLVRLGTQQISPADVALLLAAKQDPRLDVAAWTAPAAGLFFERVRYR